MPMSKKDDLLPVIEVKKNGQVVPRKGKAVKKSSSNEDALKTYLQEIAKYPLLTPEEEKELTLALSETGDIEIAKKLVLANLRLVVKIAMEYRQSYQNVLDLIQEGNIGLMKAVSKYDGSKGAKLSYYASWWIRSYILKFILDNFRLIKVGTTQDQKKLFYNLMRERSRLEAQGIAPETKLLAQTLDVSEKSVEEMGMRLSEGEVSLDGATTDGSLKLENILSMDELGIDEQLSQAQSLDILKKHLHEFMDGLKERDKEIFEKRLMSEIPESLQAIADQYGVSRERIRQVEARLIEQLKVYMAEYLR